MDKKEVELNNKDPVSIYNWLSYRITSPDFRNIIKDYIDENCSSFIDVDENTFQQGQLFNEFTQLIENLLTDLLDEGQITQEQFLEAAQKGLEDPKYKKYFEQMISFSDYNYFKNLMLKRNYALIKQVEEQFQNQKGTPQNPNIESNPEMDENGKGFNQEAFEQRLKEQEENDLQQAIKDSLQLEEEKKRMKEIEDEELKKAIDQSLAESKKKEKIQSFSIEKSQFDLKKVEAQLKPAPQLNTVSNNVNFQFAGETKKPEQPKKEPVIVSASKGFDFQIESKNKDFGFSATNTQNKNPYARPTAPPNNPNPYARPPAQPKQVIEKKEQPPHAEENLIDDDDSCPPNAKEQPKPSAIVPPPSKKQEPHIDLLQFEDKKPENLEVAKEINFPKESASSILKNAINQEKNNINENNDNDGGGLLIDDDEEDNKPKQNNNPQMNNPFIDKQKDIKFGKINLAKDGGNNQYGGNMQNYQVGGMKKLEDNFMKSQQQGAVIDEVDPDFMDKVKAVQMEKDARLREYREQLLKMKKEKRENKAREVLSPEELAKLENKKKLADLLKAKRK